jgi:FKBP-type peptidyl-prolyl cis-trans isomerase 2
MFASNMSIRSDDSASKVLAASVLTAIIVMGGGLSALIVMEPPALAVESFSPDDQATDVDLYADLVITFDQEFDSSTFKDAVTIKPAITGKWQFTEKQAKLVVGGRMKDYKEYKITLTDAVKSKEGKPLDTSEMAWTFTTGNTSERTVVNGTTAQLDFIGWTVDDSLVFATSLQDIIDDDVNYSKSEFYLYIWKDKFQKLRRFPIIMGKEDEFLAIQDQVAGMRIGETKTFTLTPNDIFGYPNASLVQQIPLNQTVPLTEDWTMEDALIAFNGNVTVGNNDTHPLWGWNVTIISNTTDTVIIQNEPFVGANLYPYGWWTEVISIGSQISVRHYVNGTHLHKPFAIQGTVPERVFMVMDINATSDTVTIDENFPFGVIGRDTKWQMHVHDIKHYN